MSSDPIANEILELLQQSSEYASYLGELGVETVPPLNRQLLIEGQPDSAPTTKTTFSCESSTPTAPRLPPRTLATPRPAVESELSAPTASLFGDLSAPAALDKSSETLEEIWQDIGDCTRCGLCEARTQVVNTHGNHNARLMFVGEAPGADEDAQGKPFVGRAGQLLTKIIEAIGLKREDVLIGNVNRCRPPGNRQPTLEEAAICRPFLFREIAAVQPEVIVVMGNTALRNLLETREGITRVRGKFQDFRGIKVMPTFHPAYLLRDPSKKRETWEDLKKVRDYLDNSATRPSHS